jgi:hypothetical protein
MNKNFHWEKGTEKILGKQTVRRTSKQGNPRLGWEYKNVSVGNSHQEKLCFIELVCLLIGAFSKDLKSSPSTRNER